MAVDYTHLQNLQAVRAALVAARRTEAQAAATARKQDGGGPESPRGSAWGPDIVGYQEQIEAIDRAIADE